MWIPHKACSFKDGGGQQNALGMQDRPWGTLYVTVWTFHQSSARASRTKPQSSKKTIYHFVSSTQISNIKWDHKLCEQQLVGGMGEAPQLDKCKLEILLIVQDAWRPKPYANFINPWPARFKWISDHQSASIICTVLNQCLARELHQSYFPPMINWQKC